MYHILDYIIRLLHGHEKESLKLVPIFNSRCEPTESIERLVFIYLRCDMYTIPLCVEEINVHARIRCSR